MNIHDSYDIFEFLIMIFYSLWTKTLDIHHSKMDVAQDCSDLNTDRAAV